MPRNWKTFGLLWIDGVGRLADCSLLSWEPWMHFKGANSISLSIQLPDRTWEAASVSYRMQGGSMWPYPEPDTR